MARRGQPMQQQAAPPQGPRNFVIFDDLSKINTRVMRQNLSEREAAWMENLQPIAGNYLKAVPAPLLPLVQLPGKVPARLFSGAINDSLFDPNGPLVDWVIFFATDGSATGINIATGATDEFAPPGTFSNVPDCTTWAAERFLILDPQNGFSTWDGSTWTPPGGIAPDIQIVNGGAGFTSAPDLTFSGGSGSGITGVAQIANGALSNIIITNAGTGFLPGEQITINISGGGGLGAVATASVLPLLTGNTLAVFQGRLWTADRRTLTWSGTLGWFDQDQANAAGSTLIADADLVHEITALRALDNYLYIFGDQSTKQIGGITVQNPPTGVAGNSVTDFQILTLASDIGCVFMMSILSYNRMVVFANKHGVYAIMGASIQKVSDDLDGIFMRIDFSQELCAAINDLNEIHCYCLLIRYLDPSNSYVFGAHPQGQPLERSLICMLQTRNWFTVQQGMDLICIVSLADQTTNEIDTFGSSGSDLTMLLDDPDTAVTYILKTSLTAHGNILTAKHVIKTGIAVSAQLPQTIQMLVETENRSNHYTLITAGRITWRNNLDEIITFKSGMALRRLPRQAPVSLFPGQTPSRVNIQNGTFGMSFQADVAGWITAILIYIPPAGFNTSGGLAALWQGSTTLASVSYPVGVTGWQTLTLATPVSIAPGTPYIAGFFGSFDLIGFDDLFPADNPPLHGLNGTFDRSPALFPPIHPSTPPTRWFGIDVVFVASGSGPPPPPPPPPVVLGEIHFMVAPRFKLPYRSTDGYGRVIGATFWEHSKQLEFNAVMMEFYDVDVWGEGPPP